MAVWRSCLPGLVGLLLAGCAAHVPLGGSLLPGSRVGVHSPVAWAGAVPSWEEPPGSGGAGGAGTGLAWAEAPEDARARARHVEEARAEALVLAARREGREPEAARKAEADRVVAQVVGLAHGVEEVGTTLAFTFWVEQGALTLVGYQEEGGGGRTGRAADSAGLARVLRHVFTEYVGQRRGEGVLRLRREEVRWAVDYEATHPSVRPPEARTLPVGTRGAPADTFLSLHAASKGLRVVQVPAGGATRVALEVRLEDGRLVDWELREVRRTREGLGGSPRPLSSGVAAHLVQALLPFTEGVGPRTVRVVLRAEHRPGETEARGWVESARVERPPPMPELSWYRSMHEAILLRWREDVHEGSAWLSQKGVDEAALWFAGGIIAKGGGFFAMKGLEWVPRALGREPELAAGWLRSAFKRMSREEKAAFERLWRKVAMEGEQALTRGEREALRSLFVRLEQLIQQPLLDANVKNSLRQEAREYYAEMYPQFARILKELGEDFPIHHRRPLQYAHLFPAEDINAGENLAMLQNYVHKRINFLWDRFRRARPSPTADEVRSAAEIIDRHFEPWYHRAENPPGLAKTAEEARDVALSELRSRFPGLE